MLLLGILITFAGFLISFLSLALAPGPGMRLAMVAAGILISLFGIIRVLNGHFVAKAMWRK